jgi:hypothetical protein
LKLDGASAINGNNGHDGEGSAGDVVQLLPPVAPRDGWQRLLVAESVGDIIVLKSHINDLDSWRGDYTHRDIEVCRFFVE